MEMQKEAEQQEKMYAEAQNNLNYSFWKIYVLLSDL